MREKGTVKKPNYVCKRGCFLDDYIKMKKIVPGYLHNNQKSWGTVSTKKGDPNAKKNTYID